MVAPQQACPQDTYGGACLNLTKTYCLTEAYSIASRARVAHDCRTGCPWSKDMIRFVDEWPLLKTGFFKISLSQLASNVKVVLFAWRRPYSVTDMRSDGHGPWSECDTIECNECWVFSEGITWR